jgi:peptidoglycan/LPS O-acetylase OafA/YrhL
MGRFPELRCHILQWRLCGSVVQTLGHGFSADVHNGIHMHRPVLLITLLSALVNQQGVWARLFHLKALGFMGTIAYGMYLYHVLVLSVVFQIFRRGRASLSSPLDWLAVAFSFVITLSLSFLSWKYFESFLVEIGHRFTYGTKSAHGQRGARAIAVS